MLFAESKLKVKDNSSVKVIKCIKVLGGSKRNVASLGEIIISSISKRKHINNLINSKVYPALITSVKKKVKRKNGTYIKFDESTALLLTNKEKNLLGNRIFIPITYELRKEKEKFFKIISLSRKIV